jgi:hypothetical protein
MNPWMEALNDNERNAYNKWIEDHECPIGKDRVGAKTLFGVTWIMFHMNQIGVNFAVRCKCGAEQDITDYGRW